MSLTARTDENELMSYSYFIDQKGKMQGRKNAVWKPTIELWIVEHYKDNLLNGLHINFGEKNTSCILYYKNGIDFGQQSYFRSKVSCEKLLS